MRRTAQDRMECSGQSGHYVCVGAKIPEGYDSSADFCMKLMEKTGVIVTPGSAFGSNGEGYVRMALVVGTDTIEGDTEGAEKSPACLPE